MALSNIFREPRREITETIIGLMVLTPYIWVSQHLVTSCHQVPGPGGVGLTPWPVAYLLAYILVAAAIFFLIVIAIGIHGTGNFVCNQLEVMGLRLRPSKRY